MAEEPTILPRYQSRQRPGCKDNDDIKIRGVTESLEGSNLLLGIRKQRSNSSFLVMSRELKIYLLDKEQMLFKADWKGFSWSCNLRVKNSELCFQGIWNSITQCYHGKYILICTPRRKCILTFKGFFKWPSRHPWAGSGDHADPASSGKIKR